ncbi:autotransporter-associated beta strand repeat-containing protein [Luteolibacter arcticus]|uniref:Autotransporter-associated beta strand repeat-containing protein n=1 Tax=Luteolibacter arcticus TaxID=1581411 RepID=A0ABT3GQI2_9BACT|nr:autotransporter-associated beta strand repeat-containing protein [Luteolibacter arcticus]MCW1925772.1 autotransporter-associated beta strand repeat-containing protein [Luteolibacter arcticus]
MERTSYALLFAALATGASHGQDIRSATADNLNVAGAWADGSPPTNLETATWNASSTLVNTLGANLIWAGLNVSAASGTVSISGANTLTPGAINLGSTNLSVTPSAANSSLSFTSLTGTGNLTINNGTANLGMTAFNTANALNFNGTLTLRGGNAATTPGAVGGSFTYLGRTGITQAAGTAFALDTGAAVANAKDLIIDSGAWGGQTIHLSSLTGFGSLRRDSGGGGSQVATVEVNQATDTVFNGMILSHTAGNNTDIRRISLTKNGVGSLTLAGIVGKQTQNQGAPASDIDLTISGGTLVLAAANTRTGVTTITAAGTLQVGNGGTTGVIGGNGVTNDGSLVFNHGTGAVITAANAISGSGTISKKGAGSLVLSGTSTLTGATTVEGGTLRIAGDLGSSPVTVQSGATVAAGAVATPGSSFVKSLTLAGGSTSTFRVGSAYDQIVLNDTNALTVSGPHVITPVAGAGLNPGDKIPIIDYLGTFSGFANLSLTPGTRFTLVHNVGETNIELEYTGGTLTWKGGNGTWDLNTTANWTIGAATTTFLAGDTVLFDDSATTGSVTLAETLSPNGLTIDNDTLAYTLSGGTIAGGGTFTKQGPGTATVSSETSYTGATFIDEGTLTFGDGATSGQIGSGAVSLFTGATLRINRSDLLDYKTSPRLRNVSGDGNIVIDGGGIVFSYPGSGIGFSEGNSWAGFSGTLTVKNGSEFRTIRNGATAMGTGSVVLGDATTSGKLGQIEGNWTWTNNITLAGPDNRIINRSVTTPPRALKLQGVLSGSGGLTFEDAAATMTSNQTGFILTGANTLSGTINIPAGVPVRVGGIPGNTDVSQAGADAFGTLGSATVANEGALSFSRTDAHTVGNTISGAGQVFIGLTTGTTAQTVTYTGTKSYSGTTTVRNGTLLVNTALPASPVVVETAGTLGGNGALGATATVSGTIAPGNGVGTLVSTAGVALENGAHIAWQVADWNGSAGSGYDTLNAASITVNAVAGTPAVVVISPASLVNFTEVPKTFTLATTSGGVSGLDADEITVDATAFAGTGTWAVSTSGNLLQLSYTPGGGDTYGDWEQDNGIAGAGAETDSDADGIPNGIEFVIGGDPSNSPSNALLPTLSVNATHLIFVFRRTEDSEAFDPFVQYGSTLTGWTPAQDGSNGVEIDEDPNFYPNNTDRVTVTIPRPPASTGKLFARLKVEIP